MKVSKGKVVKFLFSSSLVFGFLGNSFGLEVDYYEAGYNFLQNYIANDLLQKSRQVFNCLCNNETIKLLKISEIRKELSEKDKKLKAALLKKEEGPQNKVQSTVENELEKIISTCIAKYDANDSVSIKNTLNCKVEPSTNELSGGITISFKDGITVDFKKVSYLYYKKEYIFKLTKKLGNNSVIDINFDPEGRPVNIDVRTGNKYIGCVFIDKRKETSKSKSMIDEFKRNIISGEIPLFAGNFLSSVQQGLDTAKLYEKYLEPLKMGAPLIVVVKLGDEIKKAILQEVQNRLPELSLPKSFMDIEILGLLDEYFDWKIKAHKSYIRKFEESPLYQELVKISSGNNGEIIDYIVTSLRKPFLTEEGYFKTGMTTRKKVLSNLFGMPAIDIEVFTLRLATSCDCFKRGSPFPFFQQQACAKIISEMVMPVLRTKYGPEATFSCETGIAILPVVSGGIRYVYHTVNWKINMVEIILPNKVIFSVVFPIPGEIPDVIQVDAFSPDRSSFVKFLLKVEARDGNYEITGGKVIDVKLNYLDIKEIESMISKKTPDEKRLHTQKSQSLTYNALINLLNAHFGLNEKLGKSFVELTSDLLIGNYDYFLNFVQNYTYEPMNSNNKKVKGG